MEEPPPEIDDDVEATSLWASLVGPLETFFTIRAPAEEVEDLVAETASRFVTALRTHTPMEDTRKFVWGIAKNVLHEGWRRHKKHSNTSLEALVASGHTPAAAMIAPHDADDDSEAQDALRAALRDCLHKLRETDRTLITDYYAGDANIAHRARLMASAGLNANALHIRVSRIRTRLRGCVEQAPQRADMKGNSGGSH